MEKIDVRIICYSSICLFHLLTRQAKAWVENNVQAPLYFGNALACEPRFAYDLAQGMQADNLTVQ